MSSEAGTAVAVLEEAPATVALGIIHADSARALITSATDAANALASVINDKKLYNNIQGRRYVRCEGWTTLAAMLGCLPREVVVTSDSAGCYTALVELVRMADGAVLTRASAECGGDDPLWDKRQNYARRSMAVTRATSKACRIAFSWVMALAGYEVTPAEEMPTDETPRLPGGASKWDGHGGKALAEVPVEILGKARDWLKKKDAEKNAELIAAMEAEITKRLPMTDPGSLDKMPAGLDAEAEDDDLPY